ncbi:MAG: hypothetical protein CTY16_07455 [Methylobacter sp.]|nr:MAG: hypothetical protein CTY16_07455 [Methylobacter sp.]
MNVSELFSLTYWISSEIINAQIPQYYQSLQAILEQNSRPNQHSQPFEEQKDSLIEKIECVPLEQLTGDQLNFLSQLGISQAVGQEGIEVIEDILFKNVIDIATSAQKIQEIYQKLNEGISKSNQIQSGLIGCAIGEQFETENEVLMRVSFTGEALMSNITDFKDWGKVWYDIGRGIAMVHNLSPEQVKVVGATKGSIIIELAVVAEFAATASGIILAALTVAEKVLDIRKKAEELRGLKLKNDQLAIAIEQEADNEKQSGIEEITNEIVIKLDVNANNEGDKVKALDTAVKNLVNFIEKGGVVDFIMPDDEKDSEENVVKQNAELRVAFQQIRQLEKKLALLEHKKS